MAGWSAFCPACVETPLPTICPPYDLCFHTTGKKKEARVEVGLIWRKEDGPCWLLHLVQGQQKQARREWAGMATDPCHPVPAGPALECGSTAPGEALRCQLLTRAGLLSNGCGTFQMDCLTGWWGHVGCDVRGVQVQQGEASLGALSVCLRANSSITLCTELSTHTRVRSAMRLECREQLIRANSALGCTLTCSASFLRNPF